MMDDDRSSALEGTCLLNCLHREDLSKDRRQPVGQCSDGASISETEQVHLCGNARDLSSECEAAIGPLLNPFGRIKVGQWLDSHAYGSNSAKHSK